MCGNMVAGFLSLFTTLEKESSRSEAKHNAGDCFDSTHSFGPRLSTRCCNGRAVIVLEKIPTISDNWSNNAAQPTSTILLSGTSSEKVASLFVVCVTIAESSAAGPARIVLDPVTRANSQAMFDKIPLLAE